PPSVAVHRPPHSFPTRRSSDLQLFLTGRIVKRIGIGPTLLLQCAGFGLALAILGASPTLGAVAVFMVLFRTGHYATSRPARETLDRKSTRLNSSHEWISYAVFC